MDIDSAFRLFKAIGDKLRVEKPHGMGLPPKVKGHQANSLGDWPLAYRPQTNPISYPVCITWRPRSNYRKPTFQEFLNAYNIQIQ